MAKIKMTSRKFGIVPPSKATPEMGKAFKQGSSMTIFTKDHKHSWHMRAHVFYCFLKNQNDKFTLSRLH